MKSATIKELRENFNPILRRHLKNKYNSLYSLEVLHLPLQKYGYLYLSFAEKSIPTAGSEKSNNPQ